jgi:hypothetical protein
MSAQPRSWIVTRTGGALPSRHCAAFLWPSRSLAPLVERDGIDGVLNSSRTPNPRKFPYAAEPKLVARLREVWSKRKHRLF